MQAGVAQIKHAAETPRQLSVPHSPQRSGTISDCGLLIGVCLFTFAGYAGKLGFYSDDWGMFADLSTVTRPSLLAFFRALSTHERQMQMRPVQIFYLAGFYRLFGNRALAYHLTNGLMLCAVSVLLYLLSRKFLSRRDSVALSLIYSLLPHYSTARFWFSSFQAPLSCALCLIAALAMLNAAESDGTSSVTWLVVASASAALSVLAYEVTFGLMLLVPLLVNLRSSRCEADALVRRRYGYVRLYAPFTTALAAAMSYKLAVQTRYYWRHSHPVFRDFGPIVRSFGVHLIEFDFGSFALAAPYTAWKCLHLISSAEFVWKAAALAIVLLVYIRNLDKDARSPLTGRAAAFLCALGLLASAMGLGWFFADTRNSFITTGADNRITIAAALGAASVITGCAGGLSNLLGNKFRSAGFAMLVALLCGSNYLIVNAIAQYWVAAAVRQSVVMAAVHRTMLRAPAGSTVLVAGFCPYVGPGIVFETTWDMTGVLQLSYGNPTLRGDVVNSHTRLAADGVVTESYDENTYRYGDSLMLVDLSAGKVEPLIGPGVAQQKLLPVIRKTPCLWARPGRGLPVF